MADLLTEPKFVELIEKHDLKLFNGPMLGDLKPTSAKFWVRTAGPATVQVSVGEQASEAVQTVAQDDFYSGPVGQRAEAVYRLRLFGQRRWKEDPARYIPVPDCARKRSKDRLPRDVWLRLALRTAARICLEQHGQETSTRLPGAGRQRLHRCRQPARRPTDVLLPPLPQPGLPRTHRQRWHVCGLGRSRHGDERFCGRGRDERDLENAQTGRCSGKTGIIPSMEAEQRRPELGIRSRSATSTSL